MVYLDNKKDPQEVWIPRNDGNGYIHTGSSQSYQEGYEDGIEYQKSLLSSSALTENGEYERENGWSAITVNVEPTLEEINVVISADTTTITPSSGYDGFSAVTVDATEYGQTNYDSGFDDGFTDGYSSGASEGYDSGYTEGYQSGSTDGYESGYTSGETHQKSLLVSTAITQNGSYQRENGYSAITVNVPTGQTYNIEENHPFTATTNGNYTINPSEIWSITYDSTYARRYVFTINGTIPQTKIGEIAYIVKYDDEDTGEEPSVVIIIGLGNTLTINKNNWDEDDYGNVDFMLLQGKYRLEFDNDNLHSYDFSIIPYSNGEKYDVMSSVTLNVNVETASTYQSGYTSGYTDGYDSGSTDGYQNGYTVGTNDVISTFTTITATTNGVYGSSASPLSSITVNVPTGSTATLGVGSFSANGTYSASTDNLDGYSAITINVPQTGGTSVKYVEYLETDGGLLAWDTSVRITDINDVVYFDFMPINWGSGQSPVGSWFPFLIDGDGSDNFNALIRCFLFDSPANGLCFEAFDYADYKAMKYSGFTVDTRNNCIFSKNGLAINESVIQFSASNVFNTRTICINGEFNGIGGPVFKSAMGRYYGFKLIHSGQTISDLRPCLDGNDVPCFYDEVSQTYIYHSGSGTPIAGPIVDESYESGYTDGYTSGYTDGSASIASFIDRSITEVVIPSGCTKIGNNVFYDCTSLSSVTIPNSVTSIGNGAFCHCTSLSSITIPNGVTVIQNQTFDGCKSLSSVTIPSGVTKLETSAFSGCSSISSVTLPNTCKTIGNYVFSSCTSLSSVTIQSTEIRYINFAVFSNCTSLTNIYISAATAPTIYSNTFQGVPSTGTVHYPQGSDYSSWQSNTYLSGWTFIADL